MRDAALRIIERREERLKNLSSLLDSVDYRKVLERGFALVRDAQGHLVSSAKQAAAAGDLSITFADGDIKVRR